MAAAIMLRSGLLMCTKCMCFNTMCSNCMCFNTMCSNCMCSNAMCSTGVCSNCMCSTGVCYSGLELVDSGATSYQEGPSPHCMACGAGMLACATAIRNCAYTGHARGRGTRRRPGDAPMLRACETWGLVRCHVLRAHGWSPWHPGARLRCRGARVRGCTGELQGAIPSVYLLPRYAGLGATLLVARHQELAAGLTLGLPPCRVST